jgi:hypothetical protein
LRPEKVGEGSEGSVVVVKQEEQDGSEYLRTPSDGAKPRESVLWLDYLCKPKIPGQQSF